MAFGQHESQLIANALATDLRYFGGCSLHRRHRSRLNLEVEPRGKSNSAQHPQLILCKTECRIADGAQNLRCQIISAAHVVERRGCGVSPVFVYARIEQHPVDVEVAPQNI